MRIIVNGTGRDINAPADLKTLVDQFCKDSKHIIAELNGQIIKRPQWESQKLSEGDTLELVNFVGGG